MTQLAKSPSEPDIRAPFVPGKIHIRLFLVVIVANGLTALWLAFQVYPKLQMPGYACWSDSDFWLMLGNGVFAVINWRKWVALRRQARAA